MKTQFAFYFLAFFLFNAQLSGQNLGDKTSFHAAISSSYKDVGPTYLTATSNGSPTSTADLKGNASQAVQLDGVDDYISYPNNAIYQKTLPISFAVWVNLDQLSGNFPVFTTDNSTAAYAGIVVQIASGTVYISYGDGVGYGAENRCSKQSSTALTAGKWYHIAGVIRGYQNMDLYIDGVKDNGAVYSGASSPLNMAYDGAGLSIGMYASKSGGANQYFKGKIDDLHIWNRELSETEVFIKKNLLLSYSVISGGTLEDDGPYGLELENLGFIYGRDRYNRDGQTMQLNGTSTYGKIPASNLYKVQFPQTVSAWVKINSQKVFQPIYASSDHINSKYAGMILYLENGYPALTVGDNQGAGIQFRRSFVAGDSLKVGKWYHLTAVCTALGSTKMYVNGVEVTNGTNSGTGNSMVHGTGNGFAGYLSEPNGGAARYLNGTIDELMVLSVALTPAQITSALKQGVYFTAEPSDTTVAQMATVILKSKAVGTQTVSYQWQRRVTGVWTDINTSKTSDLTIASVTISDTGMYRCIAKVDGYSDTTRAANLALIPVNGQYTPEIHQVGIYPNPGSGDIHFYNVTEPLRIVMNDVFGKLYYAGQVDQNGIIPTTELKPGLYFIQLENKEIVQTIKYIKQ